ncbi:hypothetical protein [Sulfurimonas sp.]|uniref:hypothetical protein n=1 Tax=Sulfurimonas sp. TaxID=2022749 RepID=UPI002AAFF8DD|nr:hypothetical protein [Sulfurimonas sp.]
MLSKLFELLYHKVFVNIVVGRAQTSVYIQECANKGSIVSESQTFDTTTINSKMHEFIDSFTSESPFFYISILDTSEDQGALPTCVSRDMSKFCDLESSKYMCYKNSWAYYTSKPDLNELEKNYQEVGVDFIFSPFVLLANFFKDKINSSLAIFLLVENNYLSVAVFNNSELLYAQHINMEHTDEHEQLVMEEDRNEAEIDLELDTAINLEEIDALDDVEGVDDFGDIEDLDSFDDIDEFAEEEEQEEEIQEEVITSIEEDAAGFNEDYQRYSLIQSAINRFYKDERYKSEFVQDIYIADGVGVSGDLKRYLEEEMFLNVFVRHLDLCSEISELAKAELK